MEANNNMIIRHDGLTVSSQEVVEELEQRETVPGVDRLYLQSGVHVGFVERQKRLGVFRHVLRPPREGLRKTETMSETKSPSATSKLNSSCLVLMAICVRYHGNKPIKYRCQLQMLCSKTKKIKDN